MKDFYKNKLVLYLCLFFGVLVWAQDEQRETLKEVVLQGNFSNRLQTSYFHTSLKDSLIFSKAISLGELLKQQANFYLKENGYGMVSSISLRGTTAAQTAVYWNGIEVNSGLNGQTDFNTLSATGFDEVQIRRGGGSVLLGSGAVGGAINLSDQVDFNPQWKSQAQLKLGSFQTYQAAFKSLYAQNNWMVKLALTGMKSENDYDYPKTNLKNENGAFQNYSGNMVLGYQFNQSHQLSLHASYFDNDRDNSRTLSAPSQSNIKNEDVRLLLNWQYLGLKWSSTLKTAWLQEDYQYYPNKNESDHSFGQIKNGIVKYDATYFIKRGLFLRSGLKFKNSRGEGSDIQNAEQNEVSVYGLLNHQIGNKFNYDFSVRYGHADAFDVPLIFAVGLNYSISDYLSAKTNWSNNYRLPTFNDLYWQPGGNPDLKPEKSNSFEAGLTYNQQNVALNITGFYIKTSNMIQWRPLNGDIWSPVNVQEAKNYGLEGQLTFNQELGKHQLNYTFQYDFTKAIDLSTDNQLIYVPEHKGNALIDYTFGDWQANLNLAYTGKVYTTTTNSEHLNDYWLTNLGIGRSLFNIAYAKLGVNNLFDVNYQSVAYRPMPNRNYYIQLNLKF